MSSAVSMATGINTKHCSGLRNVPYSWRVSEVDFAFFVKFLVYCEALHEAHNITCYEGCSESKERLRIQPAQLCHCTRSVMWFVQ